MTNTNLTPITEKQPIQSARFIITAAIDGFPVQVEVEGKADSLRAMIDRLKAIGATPPAAQASTTPTEPTKKTAPICPSHGTPKEDLADAKRMAEEKFRALSAHGHGRVVVLPLNPATGYHDLPAVYERGNPFPLSR